MPFDIGSPDASWAWLAILLLGAVHGINPGMGWLFAVALGLQEEKGSAVWRSLLPLALGHAIAIGAALLLALAIGLVIPLTALKWIVAALLIGVGVERLTRARHPPFGGMQVGARDLTAWSFLMASAHGAGLMVVPFVLDVAANGTHAGQAGSLEPGAASEASILAGLSAEQLTGLGATVVHTIGYLVVTGLVAVLVYRKLGLRLLGKAWINIDLIWGAALIATGLVTPLF